MDYFHLKYGLFADAPDVLETIPVLGKLKKSCPKYVEKVEDDQKMARRFAREEILPRMLNIDIECSKNSEYLDWYLW